MKAGITSLVAVAAALAPVTLAQVSGTPFGFAREATGGGDATPAVPAGIEESVSCLV